MPIREYQCRHCMTEFEELVSGQETPPCAACGSSKVEALISRCAVHTEGASGGNSSSGGCSGCSGGSCGSCH